MNKHGGYYGDGNIIDFSININPLGPSERVIESLRSSLDNIDKYPEVDGKRQREAISKKLGISSENVILGNGAIQLIYVFSRCIKFKNISIVQPTFNEYERAFSLSGSNIEYFKTDKDNFNIDLEKLKIHLDEKNIDCLVLCNPNNPTGNFYNNDFLKKLLEILDERNIFLFIDESFVDFLEEKTTIEFIDKYNIFILRSLTKFYAIPGLRLGFGISHKDIIKKMKDNIEPWAVNSLALNVVKDIIDDDLYYYKSLTWLYEERDFLYSGLKRISYLNVYKTYTNFFLCRLKNIEASTLQYLLLEKDIYIRTCEDFVGLDNTYFRIAIKRREENIFILDALKSLDEAGELNG
ncbi:pyridoxal phosphate-dependent aminotransferase [Senegalia massiliensis]|uniref:Aminotransferase n=1 Tax=Senegalia massiliensis TaxID=1720316 RepID=A0A845QXI1_9CLOT|nr:histidinol-phosphate transaminase [Senegalia massiliensis]NBI06489.1 aminotransferase class I/II-fold pyridoxal phosphate-dependent enzyme [Senegalia massiliensis]